MFKKIIPLVVFTVLSLGLYAQTSTVNLTFSAIIDDDYLRLDSVMVMNRTQGGSTMLYFPDTVLSIDITLGDLLL